MDWILPATFILLALYLLKILFFWSGTRRASRPAAADTSLSVTVIVAARNESGNIDRCIESLSRLRYPADLLEVLVIDDQSTDDTLQRMRVWETRMPSLRVLQTEGTIHGMRGKANAVAQAIEHARGEVILTTDADCAVPEEWVLETVRQYTPEVGCVCGFTLIRGANWFAGMQAVDWAYLLTIASAGVGWLRPLSAVGNNMSFRKRAYTDVGGYAAVGFSVTEDFALFKSIGYKSDWKIRYPVRASTLVWSEPCADAKELYRQKKRWGRGGVDIHPLGFAIMSIGFFMNAALLVLPFFGIPFWAWSAAFAGKCLGDAFLLSFPLKQLGQQRLFRYFPVFEFYYLVYVTLLPFVVFLTGKVVWKGRKL